MGSTNKVIGLTFLGGLIDLISWNQLRRKLTSFGNMKVETNRKNDWLLASKMVDI